MKNVQAERQRRAQKLARQKVSIALAPDQAPQPVSALQALQVADKYRANRHFQAATVICDQLVAAGVKGVELNGVQLHIAIEAKRLSKALKLSKTLSQLAPTEPKVAELVAQALRLANRHEQAKSLLDKAIRRDPNNADLRERRGRLLADLGEFDAAGDDLRKALRLDPNRTAPYLVLSLLNQLSEDEITKLQKLADNGAGSPEEVNFSLAAVRQAVGDIAGQFEYLGRANAATVAKRGNWPTDRIRDENTRQIELFDAEALSRLAVQSTPGKSDPRPIFIVGMPRSGSTLVEQILSASEDVRGIGEAALFQSTLLDLCLVRYPGLRWPEHLAQLTAEDTTEIRQRYLREAQEVYGGAPVLIDKTLGGFRDVGLIAACLPSARFLHTLRHPLATILSSYEQAFGELAYCSRLEDLAHQYLEHLRLMDHWKQLLGDRILTVNYEDLVADFEQQATAMLSFCDIPWTDEVLAFNNNPRAVMTVSARQVREPIYQTSVARWQKAEPFLKPARDILAAAGALPPQAEA